jgi:DNA-binding NtrC family response regulator
MSAEETLAEQALRLDGVRVLLVEDEYYIADDLRRHLEDAGARVIGPAPNIERALSAIDSEPLDFAVLDLNLHGESAAPVADRLTERAIPFVLATGYGSGSVPDRHRSVPRCEKPFDPKGVVKVIARGVGAAAG